MRQGASEPRRGRRRTQRAGASGQGLVEYILILSLIAIVALVALSFFGSQLSDLLSTIAAQINP